MMNVIHFAIVIMLCRINAWNVGGMKKLPQMRSLCMVEENLKPEKILAKGRVKSGYGRGSKKLGFPTANFPNFGAQLSAPERRVPPGVYFGWCMVEDDPDSEIRGCVTNIGYAPTFAKSQRDDKEGRENRQKKQELIMETHVIGRPDGLPDFYEKYMKLFLVGYLRPEKKFDSIGELKEQIGLDVKQADAITSKVLKENKPALEAAFNNMKNIRDDGKFINFA